MEIINENSKLHLEDSHNNSKKEHGIEEAYHLAAEQAVGLEKSYILDMSVKE